MPLGNAWEDVMHMAVKLHNVFGEGGVSEDLIIETVWDSFERVDKDEVEDRKVTRFKQLSSVPGVSLEGAAKRAGYTEEEIDELIARRQLPMDELGDRNPLEG